MNHLSSKKEKSVLLMTALLMLIFSSCSKNMFAPDSKLSLVSETMEINEHSDHSLGSGTPVGDIKFSVTKSDKINGVTFQLLDNQENFELSGNKLYAKSRFNYETDRDIYPIKVQARTGNGHVYNAEIKVKVLNVNEAPTAIYLTNKIITKPRKSGEVIGILSAQDVDEPKTPQVFTYNVESAVMVKDVDNSISLSNVKTSLSIERMSDKKSKFVLSKALFPENSAEGPKDYQINLKVKVTDQGGLSHIEEFVLTIDEDRVIPPPPGINTAPDIQYLGEPVLNDQMEIGSILGSLNVVDTENNAAMDSVTIEYWYGNQLQLQLQLLRVETVSGIKSNIIVNQEFNYSDLLEKYQDSQEGGAPSIVIKAKASDYEFTTEKSFIINIANENIIPSLVVFQNIDFWGTYNLDPVTKSYFENEIKLDGSDFLPTLNMKEAPNDDVYFYFGFRILDQNPSDRLKIELISIEGLTNQDRDGYQIPDTSYFVNTGGFELRSMAGGESSNQLIGQNKGELPSGEEYSILEGQLKVKGDSRFAYVCYQNQDVIVTLRVSDGKSSKEYQITIKIQEHGSMHYSYLSCERDS